MEKEVERTKEIDVLRTEIAAEKKAKSAADNELDKVQTHNCAMAMELGELKAMLQSLEESSGSDAPTDPRTPMIPDTRACGARGRLQAQVPRQARIERQVPA